MLKLFRYALPLMLIASVASAEVHEETENYRGNLLKYPVVSLENKSLAKKINQEVVKLADILKKDHSSNKGYADKISMSYKVLLENEQRLNLLVYSWTYNNGAAHGMYTASGLSYDLKTGEKATVVKYAPHLNAAILDEGVRLGRYSFTAIDGEPLKLDNFWKVETVSKECYLSEDGSLTLIYQPYDLAPYAYGNTYITLNTDELQYLNSKLFEVSQSLEPDFEANPKLLEIAQKDAKSKQKLQAENSKAKAKQAKKDKEKQLKEALKQKEKQEKLEKKQAKKKK